ncbi:hypothetical protein ASPCAL07461 [Aspergillus calidoustus]|uniref:Retrotransposon gag domain-containing protein n=1 Tax=Aspergillus calidoustus TaxID=454130 RepID=A0A0U5G2X2_ASPCI|nr:hypothetical protein ASPCAL07460 [Aspergillus calidoustus]CEL06355.1 hypothetical protein ASPCAL07461 [Aspergillus calidoustus]
MKNTQSSRDHLAQAAAEIKMSVPTDDITIIEVAIRFLNLRQTGTIEDYTSKFRQISSKITQEIYVAALFFNGLNRDIQDRMYSISSGSFPERTKPCATQQFLSVTSSINKGDWRDYASSVEIEAT